MIGSFPVGRPDEMLYSMCARYSDRVQYSKQAYVMQDLFGANKTMSCIGLPTSIGLLHAKLPPYRRDIYDLIVTSTLFPLYAQFLSTEKAQALRTQIIDESPKGTPKQTNVHTHSAIPRPERLRLCPECVEHDRVRFRECYWHRVHQASGVEICPIHCVWLEDSSVYEKGYMRQYKLVSAEQAYLGVKSNSRYADCNDTDTQLLWEIACDVAFLLDGQHPRIDPVRRQSMYHSMLVNLKLAVYNGSVRTRDLKTAVEKHFGVELLSRLGCQHERGKNSTWLTEIMQPSRSRSHPLYHILLMHFLGYSAAGFLELSVGDDVSSDKVPPFGIGPWPCLNKASDHYLQPIITDCDIKPADAKSKHTHQGVFSCTCGFVYMRSGPDIHVADRVRYTRVRTYGPVWEMALTEMWQDPRYTIYQIAENLKVTQQTTRRYATELGLPIPRHGGSKTGHQLSYQRSKRPEIMESIRDSHRGEWLLLRATHPMLGISTLRQKASTLHGWLNIHDREWLLANKPDRLKGYDTRIPTSSVNWPEIDKRMVVEIRRAAQQIKGCGGKPIRVTVRSLTRELRGRDVPHRNFASKQSKKHLPLTFELLRSLVESNDDFAIRRVWWAAELYQRQGTKPGRSQLMVKTNTYQYASSPQVIKAIDEVLATFE